MIFNKEKLKCLFFPPKNGTITAYDFLQDLGWYFHPSKHYSFMHSYPDTMIKRYPNLNNYEIYVFIRNPLNRFVSSILYLKRMYGKKLNKIIEENKLNTTVDKLTYDEFINLFEKIKKSYDFFDVIFKPQFKWVSLQNIKLLDFCNYELELRKVSGNYTNPIILKNASTDFGKSVVTENVIDFVRSYYAEDYALARDRLGKEY